MTFDSDDKRHKLTVRISEKLRSDLDEYLDQRNDDETKATVVRDAIRERISGPDLSSGIEPPRDDTLRESYRRLVALSNSNGWVRSELAHAEIAQVTQHPKDAVRATIIRELQRRGYVKSQSDFAGRQLSYKVLQ